MRSGEKGQPASRGQAPAGDVLANHTSELLASATLGRHREPDFDHSGVEAEGFKGCEGRIQIGRSQLGCFGFGVKFGHILDEGAPDGHQVIAHRGELADVFALPEHHFVGLTRLVLLFEAMNGVQ